MKYGCVLVLALVLLSACGTGDGGKGLERISARPVQLQILDTTKTSVRLEDVLTAVAMIPLQVPESETLMRVDKLVGYNGGFICADKKFSSLLVFDSAGRFVKKIGKLGSGKGAYLSIEDFFLDATGQQLTVFSSASRSLQRFSLSSDTVTVLPLEFNGWQCVPFGGNRLAFYLNFLGVLNNHHNLFVTNESGGVLKEDLPYPAAIQSSFEMSGSVTRSGDGYLVAPPFGDTLYYGTAEELRPAYTLGLGAQQVPPEMLANMQEFIASGGQYAYAASRMVDLPGALFFDYARKMTEQYAIYHKQRGRLYTRENLQPDLLSILFSSPAGTTADGKLVTVIYPEAFGYYEKIHPAFRTQLQQRFPLVQQWAANAATAKKPVLAVFSINP